MNEQTLSLVEQVADEASRLGVSLALFADGRHLPVACLLHLREALAAIRQADEVLDRAKASAAAEALA